MVRFARFAISATAARYSSRFDRMLRGPVTSSLLFIRFLDPLAHAPVRYSDLVKFRPFGPEAQPLVESQGAGLSVEVHLGESVPGGKAHEVAYDRGANP